jgi:hypothetical protein
VKGLLGKPSHRVDDNIEMGVKKRECEDGWLSSSPVTGSFEHNDTILISARGKSFLYFLSNSYSLKKDPTLWS